jgi:hypothetical protein
MIAAAPLFRIVITSEARNLLSVGSGGSQAKSRFLTA